MSGRLKTQPRFRALQVKNAMKVRWHVKMAIENESFVCAVLTSQTRPGRRGQVSLLQPPITSGSSDHTSETARKLKKLPFYMSDLEAPRNGLLLQSCTPLQQPASKRVNPGVGARYGRSACSRATPIDEPWDATGKINCLEINRISNYCFMVHNIQTCETMTAQNSDTGIFDTSFLSLGKFDILINSLGIFDTLFKSSG